MKKLATLAALFIAAPLAAHAADAGLRIGVGADVAYHDAAGTHFISDNWPLAGDLMLSYWLPAEIVSLDAEISEQFLLNAPAGANSRIGTVFRPGIRVSPPVIPFYVRGAIPINIESPSGTNRETFDLRLGAGFNIPLVAFKVYLEADADFPLGGGTNAPSAFSNWQFWLNGGLDFRF
ncbi:MAG: hypothetical protein E6J78_15995 [Deltaproteobacteria bacterium]|nr:MAG: hypothetical protein E6J78_15995 [Deltaproteobacteria bacterium]